MLTETNRRMWNTPGEVVHFVDRLQVDLRPHEVDTFLKTNSKSDLYMHMLYEDEAVGVLILSRPKVARGISFDEIGLACSLCDQVNFQRHPFDLRECLGSALGLVAERVESKQLDMAYLLAEAVPDVISEALIGWRRTLLNPLSQVVKCTEEGEVVLSLTTILLETG